ncbi:hypothetical protein Dimus_011678 [Dionaea muscipula]
MIVCIYELMFQCSLLFVFSEQVKHFISNRTVHKKKGLTTSLKGGSDQNSSSTLNPKLDLYTPTMYLKKLNQQQGKSHQTSPKGEGSSTQTTSILPPWNASTSTVQKQF